jgi:hypothetical protein
MTVDGGWGTAKDKDGCSHNTLPAFRLKTASSIQGLEELWGPYILLSYRYWGLFPQRGVRGDKGAGE